MFSEAWERDQIYFRHLYDLNNEICSPRMFYGHNSPCPLSAILRSELVGGEVFEKSLPKVLQISNMKYLQAPALRIIQGIFHSLLQETYVTIIDPPQSHNSYKLNIPWWITEIPSEKPCAKNFIP